jgi:hypothetical protein
MHQSSYPLKKILLTVVFGLFSVPMIGFGAYMFVCWVRIHSSNVYYGDCSFVEAGLDWTGIGLLSFGVTWYGAWRRSFYGLLFIIPVFLSLVSTQLGRGLARCSKGSAYQLLPVSSGSASLAEP